MCQTGLVPGGKTRSGQHIALLERVRCLGRLLGESVDKHTQWGQAHVKERGECHAVLAERVECLEKLVGDSADKHPQQRILERQSR